MAGLSMPEARFAKKISFAVGGRLRAAAGRPPAGRGGLRPPAPAQPG